MRCTRIVHAAKRCVIKKNPDHAVVLAGRCCRAARIFGPRGNAALPMKTNILAGRPHLSTCFEGSL
jgi:hypothetical protein